MLILKPLDQALADNDTIRSVIVASGINQDGKTVSNLLQYICLYTNYVNFCEARNYDAKWRCSRSINEISL